MELKRKAQMSIFFAVVITIYTVVNLYLWLKGYRALSGAGISTRWYTITFTILAAAFIAGKLLEHYSSGILTDILNVTGGFWLAFMLYGTLAWLAADLLLLIQRPFHLIPSPTLPGVRLWLMAGITGGTLLLILTGFIMAVTPSVTRYEVTTAKRLDGGEQQIRIAAVSDIHLGSTIRRRSMRQLSSLLAAEEPDIVLFLGDLIDGSMAPVLRDDLLASLTLPPLRYGVWAITGNHEYIGGAAMTVPYIESKGIRVLKDEVITLDNGLQIVGRLDRSAGHNRSGGRRSLEELMAVTDSSRPVIVLDHQPYQLAGLAGSGADLQLSGHTHNGQIWPLSLITGAIYELSYGHARYGATDVIVSSGFGIWGPRMRLGTKAEVLSVTLKSAASE